MSSEIQEGQDQLREVLGKTLHRFKNNLQTQLSLMNIQTSTNRSYFDDKKVIVDRVFALTHIYDLYYRSNKDEYFPKDSRISLQSFLLQFFQYIKSSTTKIDYELHDMSEINVELDDLLLLSYIIIEINDFRKSLDDNLLLEIEHKEKKVHLKFSFSSIEDHQKFHELFKDQYKIFDLMVMQLKGKFDYKKKFVRLSFPIL
ncbi:histidine kinase dimerization/phosphoacceptor domain -containing protein [Psychroflexus sediminis]|uniref:Histidine kinase n=1 Tax=Psychroflexus sediminis TaxID=470826 RepID=A0A1G7XSJ0_9FLAO|nr:histidine kinase dimerization/phosphoacceptor domain -containing protein [Psychroflexus sediminis]SDG87056.1 Histidine kinase [Psychroflexus sediminis]